MSENTQIAWTDSTSPVAVLIVVCLVACVAESCPVGHAEAQLRVIGERLNVMGTQVSAASIAASLAREPIAQKHVESPALVLGTEAETAAFGELAVLEGMTLLPTHGPLSDGCADLRASLKRVFFAETRLLVGATRPGQAHLGPCLVAHLRALCYHRVMVRSN